MNSSPSIRPSPADVRPLRITLVPGTWAYGFWNRKKTRYIPANPPRWFEVNSAFRNKLEEELRHHDVPFEIAVHEWDGSNSIFRRWEEARRLSHKINAQGQRGFRSVVIAHSHGGNIAARAAALLPLDGFELITLATPFLRAEERSEGSPKTIMAIVFTVLCFICFGTFQFASGTTETREILWNYLLGMLLVVPLVVLRIWFWKYPNRELSFALNYGAFTRGPLLVIRGFADEASATIVLGSIGTELMNGFLYLIATPLRWMWEHKILAFLLPVLGAGLAGAFLFYVTQIFQIISLWGAIAVLLAALVLPLLAAGAFSSVFGREMFFKSLDFILSVDSVPDSNCNADVVTLSVTQISLAGMRHGIYSHPGCAPLIANWLATGQAELPYWVTHPSSTKKPRE